jgi:hypothetical protein
MSFFIRRYLYGLSRRSGWLFLCLAPLLVYAVLAASIPDRYLVQQKIPVAAGSPVSLSSSPVDFVKVGDLIAHPEELFQDSFALLECGKNLDIDIDAQDETRASKILRIALDKQMSIRSEGGGVVIEYLGPDKKLGEKIVAFYSQRLLERIDQGMLRNQSASTGRTVSAALSPSSQKTDTLQSITLAEDIKPLTGAIPISPAVMPQTALWRTERNLNAAVILSISAVLVLILLGLMEWNDPAFKSERQVARYLGVRIAGSVPDLERLGLMVGKSGKSG